MSRKRNDHPWADHPELLTSIRSPIELWRKADWNFARFEDAIFARPCDPQSVSYAAIDYCVTITSLRDWAGKSLTRRVRAGRLKLPADLGSTEEFRTFAFDRVRWQPAVEAIANTSKHAVYRDKGWPNGIAMPATFYPPQLRDEREACEDGLDVFKFMHKNRDIVWWDLSLRQKDSEDAEPGYVALGDNLDDWKRLLTEMGLDEI